MFRSATFKLTMYYLLIITIISVGFSVAVYQIGTNDLAFGLHRQTLRITTNFPVFSGSPYLQADRDLRESDQRLLARLILLNIIVLGVAGFASYALARRTLEPIEAAHERQKRFTADVSHELRTPLTALQMESEVMLLDKTASKSDLRTALASNVEEANKLTTLVSNLLRLSQLEVGGVAARDVVALDSVVATAISQIRPLAASRNINLETHTIALSVRGDAEVLVQLLVILLDNAVKYSPNDSTVVITIQATAAEAEVSIIDHGAGIPKADLEHVFERFYRADSARSGSQTGGYGLGLSIASLLADSQQASISLTSQLHKGTTARLRLALVKATVAD